MCGTGASDSRSPGRRLQVRLISKGPQDAANHCITKRDTKSKREQDGEEDG